MHWNFLQRPAQPNHEPIDHALRAMGNGDCDALRLLYAASAPEIYAFALSCLRHPQDAEDVLHDCLLRAWENAGSYRSQGKPLAWLLTIARNLCMDEFRRPSALDIDAHPELPACETYADLLALIRNAL